MTASCKACVYLSVMPGSIKLHEPKQCALFLTTNKAIKQSCISRYIAHLRTLIAHLRTLMMPHATAGITPQMMKGVTTTLSQIQQRVLKFVGPDTLLVGHSLVNDLRVLKLVHLKNLDTAILYPHARVMLLLLCSTHVRTRNALSKLQITTAHDHQLAAGWQ